MTDNEIIKAFEYCPQTRACAHAECPLFGYEETVAECAAELNEKVRDLIKRQQEEIERLEIHTKMHDEIQAEAVKEFTDRLKEKAFHDMNDGEAIVCCSDIDSLLKEMVGGSNDR